MIIKNVIYGQSLYDFAVENYGSVRYISRVVKDNGINYDGLVYQGDELLVNDEAERNLNVTRNLRKNKRNVVNGIVNNRIVTNFALISGDNFTFTSGDNIILIK